ncbi:MAG: flagellar biosynthesis repressor FlbT [Minwuiales bacterium]|nr:flagellar biosynthesis repressor FlbT [Minwuiales bacterium]
MALKLTLKPGEKFVVNGAVIANGNRRASVVVHNKVSILREKDILQPDDANSPAKRIYFAIMSMYLDENHRDKLYEDFAIWMTDFIGAISDPTAKTTCLAVSREVMSGRYYKALMLCKRLLRFERERLDYDVAGVSANAAGD